MTLIFAKVRLALLCRGTKYTGFVRKRLLRRRLAMRPLRVLNVAEKNDAAKELSRIMSRGQSHRREGYSKFNKIYEFDFNILGSNAKMVMTSLSGHMMTLDFTASHQKWYSCAPVALFSAPVAKLVGEDYLPIKRTLEREVRSCQVLIIWTDCDREGENIGFEVIDVCQRITQNLRIYRAKFSEITPQSVSRAVQNLVEPDLLQSQAVDVRMELDLRIGASFTRFQTLRLRKVFPDVLSDNLISYGSCQFPTLGFVVERYKQVQQFVPETFYKIKVSHEVADGKVDFVWKRGRLFNRLPCLILYQICLQNPTAKVLCTSSRPKSKWRPLPLDTVELEKLASRKLKINAKETMKIAEKLYNQGFISYPRTETNMFPKSLDLLPLIQNQTEDQSWGAFASSVLALGPNPRHGSKTDNAHPPIHPTKYTNGLQGNEKRVYEFIVRHFLACCSEDAKGQETSVEIEIAEERFTATGLMIIARNYLDVYPYDQWNAKTIPVYNQGEEFQPTSIEMVDGETKPPPLLTEADLIALMEKHGIGTDATHAEHIDTIKNRCYVGVQPDGTFLPGQLGMGLVEGYDLMGFELSKPRLRAELEADLKRICEGSKNKDVVLSEQIQKYKEQFVKAVQEAVKLDQALTPYFGDPQEFIDEVLGNDSAAVTEPVRLCPRCQTEQMVLKKTKDGSYMVGCQGYPRCRSCVFFPKFVLEAAVNQSVCQYCRPGDVHQIRFQFKRGSVPPMMPLEYVGCIGGCDDSLRELLDLKDLTRLPSESGGSSTFGRGQRRGNSRGGHAVARNQHTPFSTVRGASRPTNQQAVRPSNQSRGRNIGQPGGGSMPTTGFVSAVQGWGQTSLNISNSVSGFRQFPSQDFSVGENDENCVVCTCGQPATTFTVKKDGPNKGRPFYKCSNRDNGCGFFLWADSGSESSSSSSSSSFHDSLPLRSSIARSNIGGNTTGMRRKGFTATRNEARSNEVENSSPTCHCNEPAVSRTVSKEGPNKGRPFYCCLKPRGQGCDFFEWGDSSNPSLVARNKFSRTGKKRRCGNCQQEGHNKRNCPMNR